MQQKKNSSTAGSSPPLQFPEKTAPGGEEEVGKREVGRVEGGGEGGRRERGKGKGEGGG